MDREGLLILCFFNQVWKQYKADHITQSIDPGLEGKFEEREAFTVLLVGLLCTQPSVAIRPSMHDVLQMLTNAHCAIPCPKQPPFLNASVLSPEHTASGSFVMDSSALDEPKTGLVIHSEGHRALN